MESPYNEVEVNATEAHPNAWYCDICGGYFTIEDAGHISGEANALDSCKECHAEKWDTAKGKTIN